MSGVENARARSTRKTIPSGLIVKSHTIGSSLAFPLMSENVSKSGMLLSWRSKHKIPFREKTIVEMVIDPKGFYFAAPLNCLGKIVRKIVNDKGEERFGIRIIQIDPKDQYLWEAMIQELEENDETQEITHSPSSLPSKTLQ